MFNFNNAISPEDSFEIEKAISYLVINYNKSGHNSKPVILHSLRVAALLMEMGYSKKIIIGAILHDIMEDTSVTQDQFREEFGDDMLALVESVSYNSLITDPVESYKDMYDRVITYGKEAVVLKAVDIAVNSMYINLVQDFDKRKQLVEKGTYFLDIADKFSDEPAWKLLKERNLKVITNLL
jgi:guanosine-3',5'-bis(diphosphate) 3'-pyrophosphohydrolase